MQGRLKEKFLLFRIRAKKDPDAFGDIYDAYVTPIYRFIYFKVSSAEQAEDLTSETFLKAWRYLTEKRDVQSLQAMLYNIARSVVIDYYRASAQERGNASLDDVPESFLDDKKSARLLKEIDTNFETTRVLETLRGLKDEYREIVVLKYFDELSTGEIAKILDKTASNVRTTLHRATKTLADALHHERHASKIDTPRHQE